MIGQAGVIEPFSARFQSQLGALLQARQRLDGLYGLAATAEDQAEAERLLTRQAELEEEVPAVVQAYQQVSREGPTLDPVQRLLVFYGRIEWHLREVAALEAKIQGRAVDSPTILSPALLLALGVLSFAVSFRAIRDSFQRR